MTASTARLVGLTGHGDLEIAPGRPRIVGRGVGADLVVADQAVSRVHAELEALPGGLRVRDLGSANGTFVNGAPVMEHLLQPGDTLTLGRPAFRVGTPAGTATPEPDAPGRLVPGAPASGQAAETLRRLFDLARSLSGSFTVDQLADQIVDRAFEVAAADRAALLVPRGPEGALIPLRTRNRIGEAATVRVPHAIAGRAAESRRPVITDSALDDATMRSGSVTAERVRSALAVPLLAEDDRLAGVLYLDRIAQLAPFTDAEAEATLAFAGLAAVSLAKLGYAEAERRQAETRRNLERFFAPEVAARIAAAGTSLAAGGERCEATILFSDIRGFTPLAEALAPDAVATLLNDYFSAMAAIVFAHGGTLDKFLGDGLLAVWGAPVAHPDATARAFDAALAMRAAVVTLNAAWEAAGQPAIGVGFGLAAGEVFAGRIGSDDRLDYTVIGDPVNVAARLCALAGPGQILVTGAVRSALPGAFLEPCPELVVRGRRGEVEAWRA